MRILAPLILVVAALLAAAPAASADVGFLRAFGEEGRGLGQFALPDGVAIDSGGSVFVADSQRNRIQKFTTDGRPVRFDPFRYRSWSSAPGRFRLPYGVAVDPLGNLFVADTQNHRIQVFTSAGRLIRRWGRNGGDGSSGLGPGEFNQPRGIALDPFGNVWVADHENKRVQKFTAKGRLLGVFGRNGGDGSSGSGPGEFNSPRGICSDPQGNVYVADDANHRMVKMTNDGAFLAAWGEGGGFLGPAAGGGTGPGEFKLPYGCAVSHGHLFIADTNNHRVVEMTTDGAFVRNFGANGGDGTEGHGPLEFDEPYNVGVDCVGNVYVTDEENHRVQVIGDPAYGRPVCPPRLTLAGGSASLGSRRATVEATCDRICTVAATATFRVPGARARRVSGRSRVLRAGRKTTLTLRLSRAAAAALRAAGRSGTVTVRVVASGAPGADRARRRSIALAR